MRVSYQAANYDQDRTYKRYIKSNGDGSYSFCEVGDDPRSERRYDIRQGSVAAHEIPASIRAAADKICGVYPPYVDWPNS